MPLAMSRAFNTLMAVSNASVPRERSSCLLAPNYGPVPARPVGFQRVFEHWPRDTLAENQPIREAGGWKLASEARSH
jgi:hypothetical protein